MNLTEKVLEQLIMTDELVSGESLAQKLMVSRNAVWKAVEALRKQGYDIEAATNKGYILSSQNMKLCGFQIKKALKNNDNILFFDETDSTNAVIKRIAEEGTAKEGTIAVALSQNSGRGRLGRSFFSPCGGIYMSILLRPSFSPEQCLMLTVAAAVAVCRAIEKNSDAKCEIKWVNDIYINGKKVCGILTEGAIEAETATLKYAVLGIGINLKLPNGGFPEDIAERAAAVYNKEITAQKKAQLIADVVNEFFYFYENIEKKEFMKQYQMRSYLTGKTVSYERYGEVFTAKVLGIDENGGLEVLQNGEKITITAGDVSVKPQGEKNG